MPLIQLEPVSLASANVTEKMVQEKIADDPSILGLGKLELRDKAGRWQAARRASDFGSAGVGTLWKTIGRDPA